MDNIIRLAHKQGRNFLYEYEVYEILDSFDIRIPRFYVYKQEDTFEPSFLTSFESTKLVLKIIHPYILHKTDFDGVRIVENRPQAVLEKVNDMLNDSSTKFSNYLLKNREMIPEPYQAINDEDLIYNIANDTVGVLIMEYIDYDKDSFGSELFIGIRNTREFDNIISIGIGGVNTELFAQSIKKEQSSIISSPIVSNNGAVFSKYQNTLSYKRLAGILRGKTRLVDEDRLKNIIEIMTCIATNYSYYNNSEFIIQEMEINPFVAYGSDIIPLDGLFKFSVNDHKPKNKPIHKIKNLLEPKSCAIIGVSSKGMNPGRIILHNLLENNFKKEEIFIIRPDEQEVDGIRAYASISDLPKKVDLLVLAISAEQAPDAVKEIIAFDKAESVILIPGGMGETKEGKKIENEIIQLIEESHNSESQGPVFVGGNCLGVLSRKGNYDTLFIPQSKLPKPKNEGGHTALISQSGAFMITRMSNLPHLNTVYDISTGNQIDLSAADFLAYMKEDKDIKVIGVYIEGFNDQEGIEFAKNVRLLKNSGVDIIFYKAGRSPEGKTATSGHTASIAGDYDVCASILKDAGAIVCDTFDEFEDILEIANSFHNKNIKGNMVFSISNAGYEAVGMADNLRAGGELFLFKNKDDFNEKLYDILIKYKLNTLVNCNNPLDLTPMANDSAYEKIVRFINDEELVDIILVGIVPLTPAMKTLDKELNEKALPYRLADLKENSNKPIIFIIDSGDLYNNYSKAYRKSGFPVFRSADSALRALGKYINNRLK